MKRKKAAVLAMAMATCMCSAMRVEAASPNEVLAPLSSPEVLKPVLISNIHDEKSNADESGKIVMAYYVVAEDEVVTMESIANRLKIGKEYLLSENDGRMFELEGELPPYAYIAIPEIYWGDVENVFYFVQQGDNLTKISEYFHTEIEDILKLNPQITDPNRIYAEDIIYVK